MATGMLKPGDIVVDYSWARPNPQQLAAAGVRAVSRYISAGTSGKNLSSAERDQLWAAGLGILLNWEARANAPLDGTSVGAAHGSIASVSARALQYPNHLPICVSVDCGVTASQLPTVAGYFAAFQKVCPWPLTMYGGTNVGEYLIDRGLAKGIWRASATSWSTIPSNHVYLVQHYGIHHQALQPWVKEIDDNTVNSAFPMWTGLGQDLPPPRPNPPLPPPSAIHSEVRNVYSPPVPASAPMTADLQCPTGGAWILFADGTVWAVGGAPFHGHVADKPYWTNGRTRTAVDMRLVIGDDGIGRYSIISDAGEAYGPTF